jgi:MFS family permease
MRRILHQYRAAFSGLPREIWYLSVVMLVNRAGSMVMPFLSLYVSKQLEMGDVAAGLIMTFWGLGSCFGSFLGGALADRLGPFRVQIGSLFFNALGFMLLSQMTSFWGLTITVFLTSLAADSFRPANGASITMLTPPELHKRAFALNRLAINLGFTVGPTVGGFLAAYSFQFLFWIDALTCLIAAGVFAWLLGPHLPDHTRAPADEADSNGGTADRWPWANGPFLFFLLLTFATFCVFFQLISTFPLFLHKQYLLSPQLIGVLFAMNTIVVVAFEMILIHWLDQRNAMRLIAWGSLLMCLGFGMLPFGFGFWYALLTVMVWTVGEMLAMPQMLAYVASVSSRRTRSMYMGFQTTCVAIALMVGPLIGTMLYAQDPNGFWHWGTVVGVVVWAGYYLLDWFGARSQDREPLAAVNESGVGSKTAPRL